MPDKYPIRNIHIEARHQIADAGKIVTRPMTAEEWEKYGPKSDKKRKNFMNYAKECEVVKKDKFISKDNIKYDTDKVIELIKKYGLEDAGKKAIAKELAVYPCYIERLINQQRIQAAMKVAGISESGAKTNEVEPVAILVPIYEEDPKKAQHLNLCGDLHETYVVKNTAYGDSFSVTFREFGIVSALTRMSDKWNRIKALAADAENNVPDESIQDSLLDLANYAIMTVMELGRKEA